MKIIYAPLDERPCNYLYPQYMLEARDDIELIAPPLNILSNKKEKAEVNKIWNFINENAKNANIAVLSLEMIVYGGLLPSRLHKNSESELLEYVDKIRNLKLENPELKIYLSALIMRTPSYSSSDEEPDYYEEFGSEIFKRAWLLDMKNRIGLADSEENELKELEQKIPKEFIEDYETRREINLKINKSVLDLYNEGIIEFLVIPQDDSAKFGYTAIDQRELLSYIDDKMLFGKVLMYPGADEVGATLLARAISDNENKKTKIYPIFSSVLGPTLVPLYEDRPMMESLKSHVMAAGGTLVTDERCADIILAINSPGKVMQESWDQFQNRDITYSSYRNLIHFAHEVESFVNSDKKVIVADAAYSNGGDYQLIRLLDSLKVLDKLMSYKGWNTHCNTLGTTIAQGIIIGENSNFKNIEKNVMYHVFEDAFYQSKVRMHVNNNILPEKGLNYFCLGDKQLEISNLIKDSILEEAHNNLKNSFKNLKINKMEVFNPWNRMFEIGINLEVE